MTMLLRMEMRFGYKDKRYFDFHSICSCLNPDGNWLENGHH